MPDPTDWQTALPYLLAALGVGYLLGSIPFGLLITRMAGLGDVRNIGSGNIGATNVLRTGHKGLAALTLVLDALKGTVAVLLARIYGLDYALVAGFGAFLGHLFPVWLGFKGGKGVATYLGVLTALAWQGAVVFAVAWLAVAFITRYSSLAALVAAVSVPVALYLLGLVQPAQLFVVLSLLVFLKHRTNIIRLVQGRETRIGAKG
ncbi:glycerol-3-phosphate 1-O-acyltransferase PlsY [Chelativorans salis]|uniref:Glycerol-3-phosphate acyltransferase n=1 Tax=Chelativorans salis TaxID=2978478 RepID=A0ABT2LM86_9HYPH|nr:glycerol-3-phosphate 1-O-acyltransferase PlsY [Chelativorans sp. EGI FJ00035]MCT7375675.1 glycerol-3-phosphate 1-O-acyltransferase PlsY [Chelativorans sp. EGI FJ00035]